MLYKHNAQPLQLILHDESGFKMEYVHEISLSCVWPCSALFPLSLKHYKKLGWNFDYACERP
jgi:hypothetical protein